MCSVLRETISFLRTYATYGYLDGQITGMELLQSTVDALQKEVSTVQSSISNSTEIIMRRKIMELNLWLLTAFVLDFITLPPAQPSGRESISRSSIFAPADILSGVPDFSALFPSVSSPCSPIKRSSTLHKTEAMGSASSDTSLDTSARPRVRSVDFASPHDKSFSEISASDFGDISDFNSSFLNLRSGDRELSKPFSPTLSGVEQGRRNRRASVAVKSNRHNAKKWRLVETLLQLLGPIGSNTWQSIDRVERFKAAIKVGYRLGRFAMHLMQESVDSIIVQPSLTPLTPLKNSTTPGTRGNKESLVLRAIDGTYWIILRVLLDLFIQTPFPDRELQESPMKPVALRAIERLLSQLEWVRDVSKEYYDQESLFIVMKLAEVLHGGKHPISSAWSKEALATITSLLSQQRDNLRDRLTDFQGKSCGLEQPPLERPSLVANTPSDDCLLSPRSSVSESGERSRKLTDPPSILRTTGSMDELDNIGDPASVVVDAINQSLKLREEQALTWAQWSELMEPIMREALKAEKEMLGSKLNVMGLHKDSQESTRQLEEARRSEEQQMAALSHRMDDLDIRIKAAEAKHSRELIRTEEARRKRCRTNWATVYDELANERGPWGGGALDSSDVSRLFLSFLSYFISVFIYCVSVLVDGGPQRGQLPYEAQA